MVGVVQRLERQIVVLNVVGSNPITHPKKERCKFRFTSLFLYLKPEYFPRNQDLVY